MYKYPILFLVFLIQLVRTVTKDRNVYKAVLGFFILTISFDFTWVISEVKYNTRGGVYGTALNLTIPILLLLFLVAFMKRIFSLKRNNWLIVISILFVISLVNPFNDSKFSTIFFGIYLLSCYLLLDYISRVLSQDDVVDALFDGLLILCSIQLILAICFPLLGMKQVTMLFHEPAADWATRMDTRIGAVGTFPHPGNLSLFVTIASAFFLSCYLNGYRKKVSMILLMANVITLILTFSRTSYLTFVAVFFIVFFVAKNANRDFFSVSRIVKYVIPLVVLLVYLIYYSPLSQTFLESDINEMFEARMIHLYMGVEMFRSSPFFGVGLNTHIEYMYRHANIFSGFNIMDFFWENPIHNIHLIILTETGLLGFVVWIIFIVKSVSNSKQEIGTVKNILSSTQTGVVLGISIYGLTGWAPFSSNILPFILLISFFAMKARFLDDSQLE